VVKTQRKDPFSGIRVQPFQVRDRDGNKTDLFRTMPIFGRLAILVNLIVSNHLQAEMVQYSFSVLCRPEAVVARRYSKSKMNLEIEIFSTTILNSSDLCLILTFRLLITQSPKFLSLTVELLGYRDQDFKLKLDLIFDFLRSDE
jgi:hypothetical protein